MCSRVAQRQIAQRIADRLEQRLGDARRQRHAKRVAIACGVFNGDVSRFAGNAHGQHPSRGHQRVDARCDVDSQGPGAHFGICEVANREQHVVDGVCAPGAMSRFEPLELPFDRLHRAGVEQLAQLGVAEQLAQLRLIDRERLGAALGKRRVAVVQEAGDVAEQQGGGERRRRLRIHRGDSNPAAADIAERGDERRHVEEIAQALAIGFEEDGERTVPRGDSQQIRGALSLLPERCTHARAALRQQQRTRGVLAEPGGKERGGAELTHHQCLHLVGIRQQQARIGRQVDIRKSHHEPIVAPQNLDVRPGLLPDPGGDGHRPRSVDAPAARRQHADAPVAELVADALDHDRDGIGKGA